MMKTSENTQMHLLPHEVGGLKKNEFESKIQNVSTNVEKNKIELQTRLRKIGSAKIDISIERNWYGTTNRESIEKSINSVFDRLREYIVFNGEATKSLSDAISNTLQLIQMLAMAEADIYNLVDDNTLQISEIQRLVKQWCREHGIHDEEVEKLFQTSFKRAYTLRDRINQLRSEVNERLAENTNKIEELFKYKDDISLLTKESIGQIMSQKNNCVKEIENLEHNVDEKRKHINEEFVYYCKDLETKETNINELFHNQKKDIELVIENHRQIIKDAEEVFDRKVNNWSEKSEEELSNHKQILCQKTIEINEHYQIELIKKVKAWIFWGGISIVALSCCVYIAMHYLLL